MSPTLPQPIRTQIVRLIVLGWRPDEIAEKLNCGIRTVYTIKKNLLTYGAPSKPHDRPLGAPSRITSAAGDGLIEYLTRRPSADQREMVRYLWGEWGIRCHQSTVSRFIKKVNASRKKGQRIGNAQSKELKLGDRDSRKDTASLTQPVSTATSLMYKATRGQELFMIIPDYNSGQGYRLNLLDAFQVSLFDVWCSISYFDTLTILKCTMYSTIPFLSRTVAAFHKMASLCDQGFSNVRSGKCGHTVIYHQSFLPCR